MSPPAVGEPWARFIRRLEAASTLAEAENLALIFPHSSSPERSFYMNLGRFLLWRNFEPPKAATVYELQAYIRLLDRLVKGGELIAEEVEQAKQALRNAIVG